MGRCGAAIALAASVLLAGAIQATAAAHDPGFGSPVVPLAAFAVEGHPPGSAISFTDSSQGMDSVTWEGGRTEVEFADWNGDGNPDILSIGDHGSPRINTQEHGLMVYAGDGAGKWSLTQTGDFGYGGIAIGDVNNDGALDIAVGMHHDYVSDLTKCGSHILNVCTGPGLANWSSGLGTAGESWGMFGTDMGDFDNDGWLDVGSNSFGCCAGVHMYRNNHDGSWSHTGIRTGGNADDDFLFADLDADGNLDAAAANEIGNVWRGDGKGGWTIHNQGLPSGIRGLLSPSFGDVDNDGDLDYAFVAESSGGAGSFYLPNIYLYDSGWKNHSSTIHPLINTSVQNETRWAFTQLGDVDADGDVDLVAASYAGFTVFANDGAAGFTRAYDWVSPKVIVDWAAFRLGADADHNGFLDIAAVYEVKAGSFSGVNEPHFFRNDLGGGTASLVWPRGGEKLPPGGVRFVEWTASGSAPVKLEISTSGSGGPWTVVKDNLPNTGRLQWVVPNTPSKNCYAKVSSGPNTAVNARPFEILGSTGPPPLVAVVAAPNGGENLSAGAQYDVKFTVSGGAAPVSGTLELSTTGAAGPWSKVADIPSVSSGSNTHAWTVPSISTSDAFLRATLTDSSPTPQTSSDSSNGAFTIFVPGSPLDRVEITPSTANIAIGASSTFTAKAIDAAGKEMPAASFAWSVSGPFASVAPSGAQATVSGVSAGNGTLEVVATAGSVSRSASAEVSVSAEVPVLAKVVVEPASVAGSVGDSIRLKAKALDTKGREMAGVAFAWTSSSPTVAVEPPQGSDVAAHLLEAGSAEVTVKAEAGGKQATAKVAVTVKRPFVVPWDLLALIIGVSVALLLLGAILSRRKRKREEERARQGWQSGREGGAPPMVGGESPRW
jgi:hypothetical protein